MIDTTKETEMGPKLTRPVQSSFKIALGIGLSIVILVVKMDSMVIMSYKAQTTKNTLSKCEVMKIIEHLYILNKNNKVLSFKVLKFLKV